MKSLIQIVLVALVVGGLSAAGSFYWKSLTAPPVAKTDEATAGATAANSEEKPAEAVSDGQGTVAENATEVPAAGHDPATESQANPTETTQPATADKVATPESTSKPKPAAHTANTVTATSTKKQEEVESHVEAEPPYVPPVAARPPYAPEGDEAGRLIASLRARVNAVDTAERQIAEREAAMKLIFDDLRSEQANATKLRQRVIDEVGEANRFVNQSLEARKTEQESLAATRQEKDGLQSEVEKLRPLAEDRDRVTKELEKLRPIAEEHDRLQKELEKLRAAANELDQLRKKSGNGDASGGGEGGDSADSSRQGEPSPNLKKTAAIYDTMPPENTAKVVQQLVKNNRTQSAVSLLNAMKERPTSKVLSTIADSDPMLAADLTERLKQFKTGAVPQPLPQ